MILTFWRIQLQMTINNLPLREHSDTEKTFTNLYFETGQNIPLFKKSFFCFCFFSGH